MRNTERKITERIRVILKEKGMTQVDLSEKSGIKQGYLNELMNLHPRKRWNADHMGKVATALKIPVWHLFVDPAEAQAGPLDRYKALGKQEQKLIDDMVNSLQKD